MPCEITLEYRHPLVSLWNWTGVPACLSEHCEIKMEYTVMPRWAFWNWDIQVMAFWVTSSKQRYWKVNYWRTDTPDLAQLRILTVLSRLAEPAESELLVDWHAWSSSVEIAWRILTLRWELFSVKRSEQKEKKTYKKLKRKKKRRENGESLAEIYSPHLWRWGRFFSSLFIHTYRDVKEWKWIEYVSTRKSKWCIIVLREEEFSKPNN